MRNFTALTITASFIALAIANPTVALLTGTLAIVVDYLVMGSINAHNERMNALRSLKHWSENRNSTVELTGQSCELACELACEFACELPPIAKIDIEPATLVNYSTMSYKEVKALVKQLRRTNKTIKLNSKKEILVEWLTANA